MGRRLTLEEFVSRSNAIHNNKYDYSKSVYKNNSTKVIIICPVHGDFLQTPQMHLQGQGCPLCAQKKREDTMMSRYGVTHALQSSVFKEKAKQTCVEKYGVDNPGKNENVKQRRTETVRQKYGTDNVFQNESIKTKSRQTMQEKYGVDYSAQSSDIFEKQRQTLVERYGVDNPMKSPEIYNKALVTMQERYGVSHALQNSEILAKAHNTILQRYGKAHALQSDVLLKKSYDTKRKNGTFSSSQPEIMLYEMLSDIFGENDIVKQYSSDKYPFMCDFYVKSRDLYIELNASWVHGGHWYDETSDVNEYEQLLSKSKNSEYYATVLRVWTSTDVLKRKTARNNRLNYVVFWDNDLSDAVLWISLNCPDGQDWREMYSWLNVCVSLDK